MEFEFGNKRKIIVVVEGNEQEIKEHYEKYLKNREPEGLRFLDDEEDDVDYDSARKMIMIAEHFTVRKYKTYVKLKNPSTIDYYYMKKIFQLLKMVGEIKVDIEVRKK